MQDIWIIVGFQTTRLVYCYSLCVTMHLQIQSSSLGLSTRDENEGLKNCANYWWSAVCDHWGRKSISGGVKPKNKVASLMTLCRGESLLKFTTSVLWKQACYIKLPSSWAGKRGKQPWRCKGEQQSGLKKKKPIISTKLAKSLGLNVIALWETLAWSHLLHCTVALFYSARPKGKSLPLGLGSNICMSENLWRGFHPVGTDVWARVSATHNSPVSITVGRKTRKIKQTQLI